MRFAIIKL